MTAAAADKGYPVSDEGRRRKFDVEASEIIYDKTCVGENGSGYAEALTAGQRFLGFNKSGQVDNSDGAAGAKSVFLQSECYAKVSVTGVAGIDDEEKKVYASDDSTFTLTPGAPGSTTCVGRVHQYISSAVAVVRFDIKAQDESDAISLAAPAITLATAGAATYTISQLLSGLILRDPAGDDRSDVTPTAALIVAGVPGAKVGSNFEFTIRNTADAAETITVTAGSGVTLSGTMTIAQNNSKRFRVELTNVTASSEAVTIYSLGTFVH